MTKHLNGLLKRRGGIVLEVGSAIPEKEPSTVRIGHRGDVGVDIVHDLAKLPYPLPDGCCLSIIARNAVEHVDRANRGLIRTMDEWWRLLRPNGRLMISSLYGDQYARDPGACSPVTENTWMYFLPDHESHLWQRYRPKPWKMIACAFNTIGTIELVLQKLQPRTA